MFAKNLAKFRRVDKQPLLIAALAVVFVGLFAATLSWGASPRQAVILGYKRPAKAPVLGETTLSSGQNSQNQAGTAPSPQNPGTTEPSQPVQTPTPAPNPPVTINPPIIGPPSHPPCNYCAPMPGRACPMYMVYPCTPCGGLDQSDFVCRLPETP